MQNQTCELHAVWIPCTKKQVLAAKEATAHLCPEYYWAHASEKSLVKATTHRLKASMHKLESMDDPLTMSEDNFKEETEKGVCMHVCMCVDVYVCIASLRVDNAWACLTMIL